MRSALLCALFIGPGLFFIPEVSAQGNSTMSCTKLSDGLPRGRLFDQKDQDGRKYTQFIPRTYDNSEEPVPLLLYIHGQYGNSDRVARELPFSKVRNEQRSSLLAKLTFIAACLQTHHKRLPTGCRRLRSLRLRHGLERWTHGP